MLEIMNLCLTAKGRRVYKIINNHDIKKNNQQPLGRKKAFILKNVCSRIGTYFTPNTHLPEPVELRFRSFPPSLKPPMSMQVKRSSTLSNCPQPSAPPLTPPPSPLPTPRLPAPAPTFPFVPPPTPPSSSASSPSSSPLPVSFTRNRYKAINPTNLKIKT